MVLLKASGHLRPLSQQSVRGRTQLLNRNRPQRQTRLYGKSGEVEILPDTAAFRAREFI